MGGGTTNGAPPTDNNINVKDKIDDYVLTRAATDHQNNMNYNNREQQPLQTRVRFSDVSKETLNSGASGVKPKQSNPMYEPVLRNWSHGQQMASSSLGKEIKQPSDSTGTRTTAVKGRVQEVPCRGNAMGFTGNV